MATSSWLNCANGLASYEHTAWTLTISSGRICQNEQYLQVRRMYNIFRSMSSGQKQQQLQVGGTISLGPEEQSLQIRVQLVYWQAEVAATPPALSCALRGMSRTKGVERTLSYRSTVHEYPEVTARCTPCPGLSRRLVSESGLADPGTAAPSLPRLFLSIIEFSGITSPQTRTAATSESWSRRGRPLRPSRRPTRPTRTEQEPRPPSALPMIRNSRHSSFSAREARFEII
jgi:hypothetical protein